MKNFIYASSDDSFSTTSGTATSRLTLNIPGQPANPQTWLVIVSWQLYANSVLGDAQVNAEYTDSSGTQIMGGHRQIPNDSDEYDSGGCFRVFQDLSGDLDIVLKVRSVNGTQVTLQNARVLAIRIPEDYLGPYKVSNNTTTSYLGGGGKREVLASISDHVPEGRYLALACADVDLPAATGVITSCMKVIQSIPQDGASAIEMVEAIPDEFDASVPSRLTRSHDASNGRRHTFFHMWVTHLKEGEVSVVLELQSNEGSPPATAQFQSGSVLLLRLDGFHEFYDARVPGKWESNTGTLTPIISNGVGRRITGQTRNVVRLGYAVMGHVDTTSNVGAQVVIRDMENPSNTLVQSRIESLGYGAETREIVLASMTNTDGPLELTSAEVGSSSNSAVLSSGVLLSFIDEQSQRSGVPISVPIGYDWDLSGAHECDRIDLETLEKLKTVAKAGLPLSALETVEVVHESLDRVRLAVTDRLFSKSGSSNWQSLG